jgi:hypothetical protein
MIGASGVMQKQIGVSDAIESAREFGCVRVEFSDVGKVELCGGFDRTINDQKLNGQITIGPMPVQKPAVGSNSADLRRKPCSNDDERPRIHFDGKQSQIVPQNFRV